MEHQMSDVWIQTKRMCSVWSIWPREVKHVNMKWHLPLATGNASHTRVNAEVENGIFFLVQVKVEHYLTFTEARTNAEISRPAATGKTYAAKVKVYTTNIAIQTDLTRTNGKKKYTKIADIEKTMKQIAKVASKQSLKSSQGSLNSRNPPSGLSSGEQDPSKPTTRKD